MWVTIKSTELGTLEIPQETLDDLIVALIRARSRLIEEYPPNAPEGRELLNYLSYPAHGLSDINFDKYAVNFLTYQGGVALIDTAEVAPYTLKKSSLVADRVSLYGWSILATAIAKEFHNPSFKVSFSGKDGIFEWRVPTHELLW